MVLPVPVMCDRLAERCARGSGGAAAHDASASAASSSRSGRERGGVARRAGGRRAAAVTPHLRDMPARPVTTVLYQDERTSGRATARSLDASSGSLYLEYAGACACVCANALYCTTVQRVSSYLAASDLLRGAVSQSVTNNGLCQ